MKPQEHFTGSLMQTLQTYNSRYKQPLCTNGHGFKSKMLSVESAAPSCIGS